MRERFIAPTLGAALFSCPHCRAITGQRWSCAGSYNGRWPSIPTREEIEKESERQPNNVFSQNDLERHIAVLERRASGAVTLVQHGSEIIREAENVFFSQCHACRGVAVWVHDSIVHPLTDFDVEPPNPDLPDDIKRDYAEAAQVLRFSHKSSAALLRLCLEKICIHLGEEKGTLDKKIGALVEKGLGEEIQQAMDSVRVHGNGFVHAGQIDDQDTLQDATMLFELVNYVAEEMISKPKKRREIYERIPENKRQGIDQRDAKAKRQD